MSIHAVQKPHRLVAIVAICVALLIGMASPASAAPGVAEGVFVGDARSTDCTGLVAVSCTFHLGTSLVCVETVAGVPTGAFGCGVYGHIFFNGLGTTAACVGTGAGEAIVYSNVVGGWTTVPITAVVAAGAIQFAGVGFAGGSLTRPVVLEGQIALVGGCASSLGVLTGTYTVAAV